MDEDNGSAESFEREWGPDILVRIQQLAPDLYARAEAEVKNAWLARYAAELEAKLAASEPAQEGAGD